MKMEQADLTRWANEALQIYPVLTRCEALLLDYGWQVGIGVRAQGKVAATRLLAPITRNQFMAAVRNGLDQALPKPALAWGALDDLVGMEP